MENFENKFNRTFVDWTFKNKYYYILIVLWTLITEYEELLFVEVLAVGIARALMLLIPFFITYKCYKAGYEYAYEQIKDNQVRK